MSIESLSHAEIEELLGAYALDAVEADEAAIIESHLESCPRCAAEVVEHREVAAMLAHTGVTAPEGVWDRIAGTLSDTPPALSLDRARVGRRLATVEGGAGGPGRWSTWALRAGGAALAVAAVLIGVLAVRVRDLDDQIDRIDGVDLAVKQALADPQADVVDLAAADGSVGMRVVVRPDGPDYVVASDLPALADDRTYQLWGDVDGRLVSLGILGADPDVVPFETSGAVQALAVTDEVAGGVVVSIQEPVATGSLSS